MPGGLQAEADIAAGDNDDFVCAVRSRVWQRRPLRNKELKR